MSDQTSEAPPARFAFLSYVREDSASVDRLQAFLESGGVKVWRDKEDLWPGQDWRITIRQAIQSNSLVFIACFSTSSAARETSYQNEELLLAIEEFRKMPPDRGWLIPVRFDDCSLPQYDLGASRTLDSLQRVDLFGQQWETQAAKLLVSVLRHLDEGRAAATAAVSAREALDAGATVDTVKRMILDPLKQIELDDLVMRETASVRDRLLDTTLFPTRSESLDNGPEGVRYIAAQADRYWSVVQPLVNVLLAGCAWGQREHRRIWAAAMKSIGDVGQQRLDGQNVLVELRHLAVLPPMYAGGLAALHRENWVSLEAVTSAPKVRKDGVAVPLIAVAHPDRAFGSYDVPATVLARVASGEEPLTDEQIQLLLERGGKRYTPVSDYLYAKLRPLFASMILDDDDYTETFDRLEVLLGALATDAEEHLMTSERRVSVPGPWVGAFSWRDRYSSLAIEDVVRDELETAGDAWPPLSGGLFGGSAQRARDAMDKFNEYARQVRRRRW